MYNMLTVDLEDWLQSTYDCTSEITNYVYDNSLRLLDLLESVDVRATFFCLGKVVRKYPELISRIASAGHEIATHGLSHKSVKELGPEKFKAELSESIKLLEDICGQKVLGHRAPDFTIDLDTSWAFEIMREAGLLYDSSIFPIKGRRYGSPECRLAPFQIRKNFWEIPLTAIEMAGRRFPVLGGGYFRLYPYFFSSYCLRKINNANRPAVLYIHPYEINSAEIKALSVGFKTRIMQGLFRSRIYGRLETLCREYKFTTIKRYLDDCS